MKSMPMVQLPKKRTKGLVIDELPDEVLVYDLERHQAHCLNQTAALVWRHCDGKTSTSEIARRLSSKLDSPFNEELVWLALRQLDQLHLLKESVSLPPRLAGLSRRQMIRTLGIATAVAVPLVASIVAPTAVQAATCIQTGNPCSMTIECCSVLGCNGTPGSGGVCN